MSSWDDTDWYRSSRWDPEIEAAFETRLRRARAANRPQYLRIQATHLLGQRDGELNAIGLALLRRIVDEYSSADEMAVTEALEQLGQLLSDLGRLDEAADTLRAAVERIRWSRYGRNGTTGVTEIVLAQVLIKQGSPEAFAEAEGLLDAVEPEVERYRPLGDLMLHYLAARARVANGLGDSRSADYARAALGLLGRPGPFPRDPSFGRPEAPPHIVAELRRIATP